MHILLLAYVYSDYSILVPQEYDTMADMIQAVIFDMDGLMIDSEPLQSAAYETVAVKKSLRNMVYM